MSAQRRKLLALQENSQTDNEIMRWEREFEAEEKTSSLTAKEQIFH